MTNSPDDPQPADDPEAASADARLIAADRALTLLAIVSGVILLVGYSRLSGCFLRPVEVVRPADFLQTYRVDPNVAHEAELALLPGIGETLAARIVAEREANGPFERVDDLVRVRGIGRKTLERLRANVVVGPAFTRPAD
ncbi:MAG: helix-hairpin-helix domain-containing protein [Planctomycetota bacterium]